MMLGISGRPESKDGKSLEPMEAHGLQAISIGFLIDADTPMVWRGPMVTQALEQLLKDTRWRDLDYLIVDLPPGTGDIQLTLAQKVPVTGAVIVTTPQDIALIDARKGPQDVREGRHSRSSAWSRTWRCTCARNAATGAISSARAALRACARTTESSCSASCRSTRRSVRRPIQASRPSSPIPDGQVATIYKTIARRCAVKIAESQKDMTSKFPEHRGAEHLNQWQRPKSSGRHGIVQCAQRIRGTPPGRSARSRSASAA
jgi:ATP-binding protein involved in chromosome partitioning